MNKTIVVTFLLVFLLLCVEGRKTGKSRSSSGRGSSKKQSNPQPAPTSFSNPQPSAPKPSLFGWQETPAQRKQTPSRQSNPTGSKTHSYPSSQTGLSGGNNHQSKPATSNQESIQKSHATQQANSNPSHSYPSSNGQAGNGGYPPSNGLSGNSASSGRGYPVQENIQRSNAPQQANNQPSNGYPASNGLSGNGAYPPSNGLSGSNAATGHGYPTQGGGHNTGVAPPPYSAAGGAQHSYPGSGAAPPPYSAAGYKPGGGYGNNNYGNYHQPPPPYSNYGSHQGGYGGPGFNGFGSQSPGYFGGYGNRGFGGGSRTSTALKGVGIAGAGVGTLLTGLALWNLARSTGQRHHTVIYDNRGQPVGVAPNNNTEPVVDPILGDLVNCTLTIKSPNATEILGIPCAIATSFTPEADVKEKEDPNATEDTECIVTVVTKAGREFMTPISCAILLRTAAENNVTEPPELPIINNGTDTAIESGTLANQPSALMLSGPTDDPNNGGLKCTPEPGDVRDPINPCFSVTHNLTVIPLDPSNEPLSTPSVA